MIRFLNVLFVLAPLTTLSGQSRESVAGCYDVTVGSWDRMEPRGTDSVLFEPPSRIELTTERLSRRPDRFVARVAPGALPSPHGHASWQLADSTLVLGWSTGFVGLTARLTASPSGWRGSARSFGDVMPWPEEQRTLTLRKTSCDALLDRDAQSDRYLLRGVRLRSGSTVSLGSPPPNGVQWIPDGTRQLTATTPQLETPLSDAMRLRLTLSGAGNVIQIILEYPAERYDATLSRLVAMLGRPMSSRGSLPAEPAHAHWLNRTTSWVILRAAGAGGMTYVMLRDPRW